MVPRVLILGAGFGGLTAATELDPLVRDGKAEVTVIDREARFSMGFSMQWVLAGRRQPEEGERPYSSLQAQHVRFVQDDIISLDTRQKTVRTRSREFSYEYLV